jgi:hypothetical protein
MSSPAPVIIFVYNRPVHTGTTLEALKKNLLAGQTDLFIFSDGPKKESDRNAIFQLRQMLKSVTGFKSVTLYEQQENKGLARSVIDGVTQIIREYQRVIVVEDDLVTTPNFLNWMNQALDFYENENRVYSISGYAYPHQPIKNYRYDAVFFPRASTWGWATWLDRWENADWEVKDYAKFAGSRHFQKQFNAGGDDMSAMLRSQMEGRINSWGIRWCYTHFVQKAYGVFPVISKVANTGLDGSGIHCPPTDEYRVDLDESGKTEFLFPKDVRLIPSIVRSYRQVFKERKDHLAPLKNLLKKLTGYRPQT